MPIRWDSSGAAYEVNGTDTIMGDNYLLLSGTSHISQVIPVAPNNTVVSWYMDPSNAEGATKYYEVRFYDLNYDDLGIKYQIPISTNEHEGWSRYYVGFGSGDLYPHLVSKTTGCHCDEVINLSSGGYHFVPENASYMDFKLALNGEGTVRVNCLQGEQDVRPSIYHRKL